MALATTNQSSIPVVDAKIELFGNRPYAVIQCPNKNCRQTHRFSPPKGRFLLALRSLPCSTDSIVVRISPIDAVPWDGPQSGGAL